MSGFDFRKLDTVIHSKARLAIMSYLMTARECDFTALRKELGLSDGNLSTHLRKLEDSGYITVEKTFRERKPLTLIRLSGAGETAFRTYVDGLARMVGTPLAGDGDKAD